MSFKATIEADIKGFTNNIDKAIGSVDKLEKTTLQKLSSIGNSFVSVGKRASILSVALVGVGAKAFSMAADFEDALGATGQIFKDNSDTVAEWANNLDTSYGIAKKEALEYSNLMGSMLINIGKLTEEQASKQSAKLIELAGDLTAMYGGTTQDAVRALTGALKGNTQMLDNYGMGVNDAIIKQKALELGLIGSTSEMSQQAKQAATLALIWEQTGAAQGQAAREADGASGAMRSFRTEVSNLSTELGEVLLPIITPIISKLTDIVGSLRALSPEMQSMIVGIAGVTAVAGPLLVVIGNILKTLPLIKAALVALTGPIGIVVAAIAAATALIIANWDELKIASKNVVDALISDWDYMADHFKTVSASIGKVVRGDFAGWWADVRTTFDANIEYLKTKWQQFKGIFEEKLPEVSGFEGMKLGGLEGLEELGEDLKEKLDIPMLSASEVIKNTSDKIASLTEKLNNLRSGKIKSDDIVGDIKATTDQIEELTKTLEILKGKAKEIKELDTFQKLIGEQLNVRDAITKTTATIEDLQSKLVKLQLGILPSTNVRQELAETQQQINDLSTALDLLTGGRELNIKVNTDISGLDADENKFFKDGAIAVPPIDTSLLENSLGQAKDMVAITAQDLGSLLSTGISMFAQTIGDAFAGNWDGLGAGLLKAVGSLAQQFGSLIVGMGVSALKLQSLIFSPPAAIAAGAALIALGAAASGAAQKMISSATGGGGYSSAPSLRNTSPGYAPSEYRGAYQDDFVVTFKIGNDELIGTLDTAQQRRNRL